ncbi:SDR family oxidoreductase [Flavobacterium notoginsengisoli]|uniref:SDR family oxidoreductase n=1 Tax=Flavobacterium notoginsengisoli TaxID=1478199 RepID=UPI003640D995
MILVTGATGQLGTATIDFLLEKIPADEITALVRDLQKAQNLIAKGVNIKIGDYGDYDSLVEAFKGIDKLLLISSGDIIKMEAHHRNAINAAVQSEVGHIIYTGSNIKETENSPISIVINSHLNTIAYLKESGLTYTILKNNLYANIVPGFLGSTVLDSGVSFPSADGKAAFITRENIAEAAAKILSETGHDFNVYKMAGDNSYSFEQIANMLSEISGKEVTYLNTEKEEFVEKLTKQGYPEEAIAGMTSFGEAIKQGSFDAPSNDFEKLLGRKATTLKTYLESVYSKE